MGIAWQVPTTVGGEGGQCLGNYGALHKCVEGDLAVDQSVADIRNPACACLRAGFAYLRM